jgi:hypothetical protein
MRAYSPFASLSVCLRSRTCRLAGAVADLATLPVGWQVRLPISPANLTVGKCDCLLCLSGLSVCLVYLVCHLSVIWSVICLSSGLSVWSIGLIILPMRLNSLQNDSKVVYFDGQKRALSAVG